MSTHRSFKKLQEKWYKRLKNDGFTDIEDTAHPERPLKEWHSLKAKSKRYRRIQDTGQEYQEMIEDFFNHISFGEACRYVTRHGNCKFSSDHAREIWKMHIQGMTIRKIAKKMNKPRDTVFTLIIRFREWMKYI